MSQVFDRVAAWGERVEARCRDWLCGLEVIGPLQPDAASGCGVGVVELQRSLLPQELDGLAGEFLAS